MIEVTPESFLIARPSINYNELHRYLEAVGAPTGKVVGRLAENPDGESLVEVGGRLCYRSWEVGLNANVTKIREDSREYLGNILSSRHGSVLEHANYSFVFHNVSRVFTHEMVRHRAGIAVSQESMRFVRLTEIPFWFPDWAKEEPELMSGARHVLRELETFQRYMALFFDLDNPDIPFSEKKHKTSFMRRFAPEGVATGMLVTFNIRALRHVIAMRTNISAEEEIRLVFDQVAEKTLEAVPNLMQDYNPNEDREWIPDFVKV